MGGGSKERRGLFRARCAALRRQIAGSGLPFTSGFVCFVLGFWLFFLHSSLRIGTTQNLKETVFFYSQFVN